MINDAVEYIRREIVNYLGVALAEVTAGDVQSLKELATAKGIYISLINLEKEKTLQNLPNTIKKNNKTHYQQPPVHLNLTLLFSFDYTLYDISLLRLSQTIEFFQSKSQFNSQNSTTAGNPFPSDISKLVFDMHSMDFEKLNHLWGIMGGAYLPSVVYKVRMIKVQKDETLDSREIKRIDVETFLV